MKRAAVENHVLMLRPQKDSQVSDLGLDTTRVRAKWDRRPEPEHQPGYDERPW